MGPDIPLRMYEKARANIRTIAGLLAVLESIALVYFSVMPSLAVPGPGIPFLRPGDLMHFLGYMVYGFLLATAFGSSRKNAMLMALLIGSGFGLFTESLQLFVPMRYMDFMDWVVNTAGAGTGGLLVAKTGILGFCTEGTRQGNIV